MTERIPRAKKIMLMRHAEKPAVDFSPFGVTLTGERSKESLTPRGWQRAGALVNLFAPTTGRFQHQSLAQPKFLYTSKPLKRKGSRRPIETITPLSEKLAIRINSDFPRFEIEEMLEEVFLCSGVVLICWQREYIPKIAVQILGNNKAVPRMWPEDRFDMIWVFDRHSSAPKYRFSQVPQKLLVGDRVTPIR